MPDTDTPAAEPTDTAFPADATPPTTFSDIVRLRINLLLELRGFSLRSLSLAMGWAHNGAGRKLCPSSVQDTRELTTSEVDEMLKAMELPPDALFRPVLGTMDMGFMRWVRDYDAKPTVEAYIAHAQAMIADMPIKADFDPRPIHRTVYRLRSQGFLTVSARGTLRLTRDGAALIEDGSDTGGRRKPRTRTIHAQAPQPEPAAVD